MDTHDLYNNLPSLDQATSRLYAVDGGYEALLNSLGRLFKRFPQFGICLIHAHCELEQGERMVSAGRISEPKVVSEKECYPERWLSNGYPYEFSSIPTVEACSVPQQLVDAFHSQLKDVGGKDLTGLFGIGYIHDPDSDGSNAGSEGSAVLEDMIWIETTVERKNILEPVSRAEATKFTNAIPAAWNVSVGNAGNPNQGADEIVVSISCRCTPKPPQNHANSSGPKDGRFDFYHNDKQVLLLGDL